MFANTPIGDGSSTDLGTAFEQHLTAFRGQKDYAFAFLEKDWLDVIRQRAIRDQNEALKSLTAEMLALLFRPSSSRARASGERNCDCRAAGGDREP